MNPEINRIVKEVGIYTLLYIIIQNEGLSEILIILILLTIKN